MYKWNDSDRTTGLCSVISVTLPERLRIDMDEFRLWELTAIVTIENGQAWSL